MMSKKRKLIQLLSASFIILFLLMACQHLSTKDASVESNRGGIYLVGMGPGDPDLTTLRAIEVIKQADLIICSPTMRERFSRELKGKKVFETSGWFWRFYGKDCSELKGKERSRCEEITGKRNEVIARVRQEVKEGKRLAILDRGDPLIYGPWAWSLEEFQDLDPVVVPGVSCFNAAHAALKKDVTWSDTVKSTILTANDWPGTQDTIKNLASNQVTMVIFMMGIELKDLIVKLSTHYSPHTPIAIICHAGYKEKERVIKGTLATILDKTRNEKLSFEHLVYVGENLNFKWKK
ncbi:MAG: SAM-dependent methyltransferase [Thermodesulfobacteriota bacterium]|nr:SAM-dependent methyltransferase [Thermodesulfobacteriota bacterium]